MNDPHFSGASGNPVTDHLDLWTSALLVRSTAGRGSNGRLEAYGIKKLRALILELAMRGKLVPKTAGDKPAIQLLETIEKERARLIKEGFLKKEKPLPVVSDNEKTCELPQDWFWVRFGNIAQHNSGKTLDRGRNVGELRDYITTSNLYWGRFELSNVRKMPISDDELVRCTARNGDLLICEGGESGRAAVWPHDYEVCFQNHVHRARFFGGVDPYFVYRFFEKLNATGEIDQYRKGVGISNMSSKALASIVIPLPPLAQQHRIVAKVDELMASCDQLEQQQGRGIEAHQTLVEALLGTLTNVESAQEFAAVWSRIAEHFDTLFTTEHSIDQLKQTIRQLAVMGKLVPQDGSGESAVVLLQRITAEKEKLLKAGEIYKSKPLPAVTDDEKGFELPANWAWTRFDEMTLHSESGWSPSCESMPRQGNGWGVLKVSAVTWGKFNPNENKALPGDLKPRPDFEVRAGDFLISRANTAELVARAVVVPDDAPSRLMMSDKIIRFVFSSEVSREYLSLVNGSERSREYYARVAGGTSGSMKNVSREQIRNLVVALPPFEEQHRIVAKIDELMALCDALKARLAEAQTTQIHLADAIVERTVAAPKFSAA